MRGRTITIGVGLAPARGAPFALLPNGDASSPTTPPTLGSGVVISGAHFTCTAAGQIVTWSGVLTIGHRYYVTLDYNASSANGLRVNNSTVNGANTKDIQTVTADGVTRTLTFYAFTATNTDLSIEADSATFTGWIDNVVATELSIPSPLTNGDFYEKSPPPTFGGTSSQSPGFVSFSSGTGLVTWTGVLTVGQQYSIAVNYNCSSGSKLRISNSATDGTNVVDIQTLTVDSSTHTATFATFTASSADLVLGADTAVFVGTLTNVAATNVPSSSSTGTGVSTEDTDTTAASGTVAIAITGASTETADTTAANGAESVSGSGASTESTDTTAASGTAAVSASGASTEGTDTTTGIATASVSATGASTESADNGGGSGAVSVAASGARTEGTDTTSAAGAVSVAGSGASTEATDTASGAGATSVTASGASTEGTDNGSGSGTVAQPGSTGTGAGVGTDDTTSGAGLTLVSGTGSALEALDTCAGTGSTLSISFGHIKLWMGTGFAAKPVKVWNGIAWVEKPLKYWTGTTWRATSY